MTSKFTYRHKSPEIDIHDVHDKVCIIRVEDPVQYERNMGVSMTKFLKSAGAALVIIAKPDDKIDVLSDDDLAILGLKRINGGPDAA